MYQMQAFLWNQLAEEQPLLTPMANRLLVLDQDSLDRELDKMARELSAKDVPSTVISAYQQVVLLLWENEAFQAFAVNHPQWMGALPDVGSLDEALMIAALDRPMTSSEIDKLSRLLMARPQ